MDNFWFAFGLTAFAGLSTGFGSLIAFVAKTTNKKFLSVALGFSAGVMIYISLVEIFIEAKHALQNDMGPSLGYWMTIIAFFAGMLFIAIIDKLVPSCENPHEIRVVSDGDFSHEVACGEDVMSSKLLRSGVFMALAIAIHNFPEGFATFVGALKDPRIGIPIAIAIAIHNIPEGVAVSVPIYYATNNKKKAFIYSFLSGLAEPLGALVGYFLLIRYLTDITFGFVFASVAGIMVYISFDELLPAAREYGEHHLSIYGLVSGMAVMAISLVFFV